MIVRKPSIFVSTYLCSLNVATGTPGSSASSRTSTRATRPQPCRRQQENAYATIAGEGEDRHDFHGHNPHEWPKPPKGQPCPTPYQIFAMRHNAEYSKSRFYELVKRYHPDRNTDSNDAVSLAVRIERYRLIVAAHTILSDPTRRSAYDRFGAGWNGKAELGGRETWYQPSPNHQPGPFSHNWSRPDDTIWRNATWEDWEQYHARRAKEAREAGTAQGVSQQTQTPVYLQNSYFLVLVAILAMLGSSANYSRAQDAGTYIVQQRDVIHDKAARDLRRAKQEASGSKTQEARIEWFLRNREATMGFNHGDIEALRDEKAHRLLPDREVCRSDEVVEKEV